MVLALCLISSLLALWPWPGQARAFASEWSSPYQLSTAGATASEGYLTVDAYGFVHAFWTETSEDVSGTSIQYSRFDGATWSTPIAVYVARREVNNVSPAVDQQETLHIGWTEGLNGPAYFASAPAANALSARNWSEPVRVELRANRLLLRVDGRGTLHVLYISRDSEPGVYYVRSEDQGATWTEPTWLDPDILPDHIPDSLNFELDGSDGLHAVWFYGALTRESRPDWVRYAHSLDGGQTWSSPYMIDKYTPYLEHNLESASPRMIVRGQTVHVIWAAGQLPYRYHRYSADRGQTWSTPRHIFGDLHGQAFDTLTADGAGRVHFLGQIRYPMGIYHAYWDHGAWTQPALVYRISQGSSEALQEGRVHAHDLTAVVRAGNQLVLTFADPPADPRRRLFAMHRLLDDVPPIRSLPVPTSLDAPTAVMSPTVTPATPTPAFTSSAPVLGTAIPASGAGREADVALRAALVPTILLLGTMIVWQLVSRLRQRRAPPL
jgi:hypothetical protein